MSKISPFDPSPESAPIYLWPEKPLVNPDREIYKDQRIYHVDNPCLEPFWPDAALASGAAALIFPGGGYSRLAINNEGRDMARWLATRGVAAFVVKYRLQDYGFPAPLLDAQRALRLVRQKADAWVIDPRKIGVVGFSAGGHVAASLLTHSDYSVGDADLLRDINARPDFAVLGYPVISMEGEIAHAGSRKALLGDSPEPAVIRESSLQYQVPETVPPVFMFHGTDDQAVPAANSLIFFNEVLKYNRRSELHLYQSSIHGVGVLQGQGTISGWLQALERWLLQNGHLKQA